MVTVIDCTNLKPGEKRECPALANVLCREKKEVVDQPIERPTSCANSGKVKTFKKSSVVDSPTPEIKENKPVKVNVTRKILNTG